VPLMVIDVSPPPLSIVGSRRPAPSPTSRGGGHQPPRRPSTTVHAHDMPHDGPERAAADRASQQKSGPLNDTTPVSMPISRFPGHDPLSGDRPGGLRRLAPAPGRAGPILTALLFRRGGASPCDARQPQPICPNVGACMRT
jgi:hypothetical protein